MTTLKPLNALLNNMSERQDKMNKELMRHAGAFINENSNRQSMITVTRVDVSPNFKSGTIYISVIPSDQEEQVLYFLKRNLKEMRMYIKKHLATRVIPFLDIDIDAGEKHRQRIDELSREARE